MHHMVFPLHRLILRALELVVAWHADVKATSQRQGKPGEKLSASQADENVRPSVGLMRCLEIS